MINKKWSYKKGKFLLQEDIDKYKTKHLGWFSTPDQAKKYVEINKKYELSLYLGVDDIIGCHHFESQTSLLYK